MHKIHGRGKDAGMLEIPFDYYPDSCPACHTAVDIKPYIAEGYLFPNDGDNRHRYLQIIFQCPRLRCGTYFIVQYEARLNRERFGSRFENNFRIDRIFPNIPKPLDIPKQVSDISPRFVAIANQANAAEAHSLHDIAGMGYRKALEFLIKDYCINRHRDDESAIKAAPLMQCINKYVSDLNVKQCATRAAWLGNDETHYERVWTDRDIKDLKVLIQLTQNWIHNDLLTAHYVAEMDSKKKG
jgi:hypothetical protein